MNINMSIHIICSIYRCIKNNLKLIDIMTKFPQRRCITHMFTTRSYMRFDWLGNVVNRLVLFMVLDILFKSLDFCDIYLYCWVINNLLSSQFLKCIGNFYIFCRSNNVWDFQLLTLVAANNTSTKNVPLPKWISKKTFVNLCFEIYLLEWKIYGIFCYIPFCIFLPLIIREIDMGNYGITLWML